MKKGSVSEKAFIEQVRSIDFGGLAKGLELLRAGKTPPPHYYEINDGELHVWAETEEICKQIAMRITRKNPLLNVVSHAGTFRLFDKLKKVNREKI